MAGPYFLGVDGGGTKTSFVLIDGNGAELARHTGPTSYHLQIGIEGLQHVLADGVAHISAATGISANDFSYSFFGLPALGEDSRIDGLLATTPKAALGHDRFACGNDMVCGWAGSLGCADGINIVAGTGSIAYGERGGNGARAGGWGEYFGDEGSAYWIAMRGLNLFTRMSDGRSAPGPLAAVVRAHFGLTSDLDICGLVMGDGAPARDFMAGLALLVVEAADKGDVDAAAILRDAGTELAQLATALHGQLGFEEGETAALSWSGSVFRNAVTMDNFQQTLAQGPARFHLVEPIDPPDRGAALYARHLLATTIIPG